MNTATESRTFDPVRFTGDGSDARCHHHQRRHGDPPEPSSITTNFG